MFWGVLEHLPAVFQWFHPPQLPSHPTVTPLSGGLSPAALCSTACGASRVPPAPSGMGTRSVALKQSLSRSLQCQAMTFELWDSFPWLGCCSRTRPAPQCRAPRRGPGWGGDAGLLALPPSARWGTWHQPRPSAWSLLDHQQLPWVLPTSPK